MKLVPLNETGPIDRTLLLELQLVHISEEFHPIELCEAGGVPSANYERTSVGAS